MRITPLDIRKQEFHRVMRGLDAEEVYAFLSTIGDEYEALLNDNKALRDRLLELDDKVQEYRTMEKTLRDTLLTASAVLDDPVRIVVDDLGTVHERATQRIAAAGPVLLADAVVEGIAAVHAVEPAIPEDARGFAENGVRIRHEVQRMGVPHQVE